MGVFHAFYIVQMVKIEKNVSRLPIKRLFRGHDLNHRMAI